MNDANIPIIGGVGGNLTQGKITNLTLMAASIPDLLAEIERRGVNLPETSFQLVQAMHDMRNQRWNANNGNREVKNIDDGWVVLDDNSQHLATFYGATAQEDAYAFANPQFTIFERAAEVAGEVGELVNAVKKLRRHDIKMPGNYKAGEQDRDALLRKAAYEIGDVFVTAFNLAHKLNLDAWNCLQLAFNTKSQEMGFPEKL